MQKLPKSSQREPVTESVSDVRLDGAASLSDSEVADMQKFAQEIASIYADLAARQKPLGREFEVAWDENADLLYES